jgi:transcription antitermination factor NusB
MRKRTKAREVALQMLYEIDAQGEEAVEGLESHLGRSEVKDAEIRQFAEELIRGTREATAELDKVIAGAAQNWAIHRMAVVDRNILRMAVYEMIYVEEIPAKVSINEAIELGKRFSTEQSGSFINGILDRIRRERGL